MKWFNGLLVSLLLSGCVTTTTPTPAPVPDPVPTPAPVPVPVPASSQIKAAMFLDATGCPYKETINTGVTSPQAWASSHGKSWENGYRADILDRLQAAGSDTLVYIVDGYFGDPKTSVLAMCLADMGHPDDGRHADQSEGWYTRSIAKGIKRHIAILRDSPDTKVPATKQSVVNLVAYYKGSRFDVIYLTGLESNRNRTVAQTVQDVKWLQELAPGKRVVAGSSDPNYLLAVADGAPGVELWLEQADSLMAKPLTTATAPAYLTSLDKLAAKVGAGRCWAGEWWCVNKADRIAVTKQILAKGYNAGCGQF